MLDRTLTFLLTQLNDHLGTRYPSKEPHVVLSSLSTLEGTAPPEIANRVVLSLVNIERETSAASAAAPVRAENGGFVRTSPALNLDLYVLVSASFGSNYVEALKLPPPCSATFRESRCSPRRARRRSRRSGSAHDGDRQPADSGPEQPVGQHRR